MKKIKLFSYFTLLSMFSVISISGYSCVKKRMRLYEKPAFEGDYRRLVMEVCEGDEFINLFGKQVKITKIFRKNLVQTTRYYAIKIDYETRKKKLVLNVRTRKLGAKRGCLKKNIKYCVGTEVLDKKGYPYTIEAVFSNGKVALRGSETDKKFSIKYFKELALTKGASKKDPRYSVGKSVIDLDGLQSKVIGIFPSGDVMTSLEIGSRESRKNNKKYGIKKLAIVSDISGDIKF